MRIIAGKYRSRVLKALPGEQTRPTLDQIKESFFNAIGPYFEKGRVLDVFGGSGAIALEFLSRGIQEAVIIEKNKAALNIIKENCSMLESEAVQILSGSYIEAIKKIEGTFDYIYCDPPYQFKDKLRLFESLKPFLRQESILFYEADKSEILPAFEGYELVKTKLYKRTQINWFRLKQSGSNDDLCHDLVGNYNRSQD